MQENYISLNPANTQREESFIRKSLYSQRLEESQGGAAGPVLGIQFGLTGSVLTYSYLAHRGFKFLPLSASNAPGYGKILAAYVGLYMFGHSYVMHRFGDADQYGYLMMNRRSVINGTKPWEKGL